jgi:hypothetical protein
VNTSIRRNSGSTRTVLLCLVAAVVGGTACLLYCPNKNEIALRTAVEGLRKQIQELEAKAADPKEVEKLRAQVREAAELKKEAEEVHRLRGELTLLRRGRSESGNALAKLTLQQGQAQTTQRLDSESQTEHQTDLPAIQQAQVRAFKSACIENLKEIDAAVQLWALESKKVAEAPVDWKAIRAFLAGGGLPVCPGGGVYGPAATVSGSPTCSVPGHTL